MDITLNSPNILDDDQTKVYFALAENYDLSVDFCGFNSFVCYRLTTNTNRLHEEIINLLKIVRFYFPSCEIQFEY
jgi:hypothetical protein